MNIHKITIGTRGSPLALIQTEIVKQKLLNRYPHLSIEIKTITTEGDINLSSIPLDTIGKAWFTQNIENYMLDGSIDIAVHSLKDLPTFLPKGLMIGAICEREDPRDVLVSTKYKSLGLLPKGARIGTDSLRRQAQLLNQRPDLIVESVRGNVATRLSKLDEGEYDAIVLAAAGLKRLGITERIAQYFSAEEFIPAPGQGALVIEVKENNISVRNILSEINNEVAYWATAAEREFSYSVDGGCKNPVGAYARIQDNKMILTGMIATPDGTSLHKQTLEGIPKDAIEIGKTLAQNMLMQCSWYTPSGDYDTTTQTTEPAETRSFNASAKG